MTWLRLSQAQRCAQLLLANLSLRVSFPEHSNHCPSAPALRTSYGSPQPFTTRQILPQRFARSHECCAPEGDSSFEDISPIAVAFRGLSCFPDDKEQWLDFRPLLECVRYFPPQDWCSSTSSMWRKGAK